METQANFLQRFDSFLTNVMVNTSVHSHMTRNRNQMFCFGAKHFNEQNNLGKHGGLANVKEILTQKS